MNSKLRSTVMYCAAVVCLVVFAIRKDSLGELLKGALPIRQRLIDLDRTALLPYEVVATSRLSPDIEHELGTLEYISWTLQDPSVSRRKVSKKNKIALTVSYYTNVQDQVPHVPEECYQQGAFVPASAPETFPMEMGDLGKTVEVKRLQFYAPNEVVKKTTVYYTICVNGEFHADRLGVRNKMADTDDSHLYYSKVEVSLGTVADAELAKADERARKVLDKVLTELTKSHWPLPGSERGGPQSQTKDDSSSAKEAA